MNTVTLARLAQRVADQLVTLHGRLEDGTLTREQFVDLAVAFLTAARARATALADVALAAELSRLRGHIVNVLGLEATGEVPRSDVTETLDSDQYRLDAPAAVAVLGRALTLDAAQQAIHDGMVAHGVEAWVRDLNTGACELCVDLAGQGEAPITVNMHRHKGCGCAQRPVA